MTVHLPVQDGALTLEQWRDLEALARTLSPEQARWISGYFAGLDAGLLRRASAAEMAPTASDVRTLTILFGSETGNGRNLATALASAASERGLSPRLADMAGYKVRQIGDEQDLLIIVSTHGEGDPPAPAAGFFEFLESGRAPNLAGVRFAVLALGDSTYEKYCEAGKRIDRRLQELGATRLVDRVDCDVDYDEPAASWSSTLVGLLVPGRSEPAPARSTAVRAFFPLAQGVHDRRNPFAATVLETIAIVGRNSSKETHHVELGLQGSGLTYRPGDSLGVLASNSPQVVESLLEAIGLSGETEVNVKGSSISLASALTSRFEITCASPRFVEQWTRLSGASELQALNTPEATAARVAFLDQHHVADIVRRFPVNGLKAEDLLVGLRPLQPRLYSIASSQAAVGDEAHLTVVPVRYKLHGTIRGGVASTYITDRLEMGAIVPVYVQENPHFRLPGDKVPIIMVGAGTGIAPFRAFLQEREMRAAGGRSWLFFGERNLRSDFLYQLELQQWLKDGVLTRLDVAFSRDGTEKVYVQHRMLEFAGELYDWLEKGAHFYVCGDEKKMSRDVDEALLQVIEAAGSLSRAAAEDYVRRLVADQRYQKDVY